MVGENLIENNCYIKISNNAKLSELMDILNKKMYMSNYIIEIKNKNDSEIIKEFFDEFTIEDILCPRNIITIGLKYFIII